MVTKKRKIISEKAEFYATSKDSAEKISLQDPIKINEHNDEEKVDFSIDIDKTYQTIEGFGGSFTDASAETFYQLSKDKQKEILDAYFTRDKGIGFTLCRTHINSCDFSSESYTYVPEGDEKLEQFSVDIDKRFRTPFIKEALEHSKDQIKILASPWSPPAWMKSNGDMLHGGKLLPKYNQTWADYYIKFMKAYKEQNIPIWGLSMQNEPGVKQFWESCLYSAEEERDFIKNYLGPTIHKSEFSDIKLVAWDHNRDKMLERARVLLEDSEAAKYVWGIGFHWYDKPSFENVRKVQEEYPEIKTLLTEACFENFDISKIEEWKYGEFYATSMIKDLNNGAVGWIDWNLILNEKGGPNHVENYCFAPVICDTKENKVLYMNSYHYIGHFSKFIRPGARRLDIKGEHKEILRTAFINPDGKVVIVILNKTGKDTEIKIQLGDHTLTMPAKKRSVSTILIDSK